MSTVAARRAPRIVFNSDGDIHFRGVQSPQDMDGFYRGIDELAGTQVDCYCYCISAGGDTYRHPSDVAPLLGADLETLDGVPDYLRRDIENTRALLAAGIDPLVLLPRRARGHGMEFWASMRMNDIHDDYPECAAYHGGFRKAHPELLLGSPYPEPKHRGNWRAGFCWGLDYARPEVRERQLALIEEVLTRYDVDGFELDFLRGAYYFKTDERGSAMPLMTDFVRGVRRLVDRAGEGKGRPLTLAIRVGRDVEECRRSGLDVRTWAAEGLADLLIPMWAGRMDTEADVAGMVALARTADSAGTRVAGGLVGSVYGYGILPDHDTGLWCNATLEMLRAGAMTYFSQGAACTYLFNYDCQRLHGVNKPYSHGELQALREIGDAAALARLNKRYSVTVDGSASVEAGAWDGPVAGNEGWRMQLPALLRGAGDAGVFRLWIGDDLAQGWRDDVLDAARIRITAEGYRVPDDAIELAVNGAPVACDENAWRPHGLLYTLYASRRMRGLPFRYEREDDADVVAGSAQEPDLLRQGRNELTITVRRRRDGAGPLRIIGIEALIKYDGGE